MTTAIMVLMQSTVGLGMNDDFRLIFVGCEEACSIVEDSLSRIHYVDSVKNLVRLLIDREVDLIVIDSTYTSLDKLKKIFQVYSVPFMFIGEPKSEPSSDDFYYMSCPHSSSLLSSIEKDRADLMRWRAEREKKKLEYVLEATTLFTNTTLHTTKDLFISEVKNYFSKNFKIESCHWVEVKSTTSKLPPILKLKQELENQKVDQGALISDLDSCSYELFHSNEFQVWKTSKHQYIALLWVHQDESISQCIILNKLQLRNRSYFQSFMQTLAPFLQRRWSLCLTVGEAQQQVYKDSLTDLYNQKFLMEVIDRKIEEFRRYKTPFSILFIDVDHFKRVNDSLGHVVGSGVLTSLGGLLQEQIRSSDYAFRYGGDEFIILLSHTEGEDAVNVAERVRKRVENFDFNVMDLHVRITVSIGLAFFPVHADSAEDIVRIADEAMYYGKNKSRNIVYKAS